MRLDYSKPHQAFVCHCSYAERLIPKGAQFVWNKIVPKAWATRNPEHAAELAQFASPLCREVLSGQIKKREQSIEKSSATDANIALPVPEGEEYFGYQKAGILWEWEKKRSYNADDMGLGKTIQAIGLINAEPSINRVLVITKASLRVNWENELKYWLTRPLTIGISWGSEWPAAQVVIIGYDTLIRHKYRLDNVEWDLIIVDEAQMIKNPKAQRSKMVLGYKPSKKEKAAETYSPLKSEYALALSGSPLENRATELFGVLHWLDPVSWPNYWWFAQSFCGAEQKTVYIKGGHGRTRQVWDFSGSSNEEQLQQLLRKTVMIRRKKDEVDIDLPPKRYQVIEIPVEDSRMKKALAQEVADFRKATAPIREAMLNAREARDVDEFRSLVQSLGTTQKIVFQEFSKKRKELGLKKIPYATEYLKEMFEDDPHKVLVFGHHQRVLEALHHQFKNSCLLYGPTPQKQRQPIIDRYNTSPDILPFFGSINAAGVGLNLTSASHVVFVEEDLVPERMNQAADRAHRIGQKFKVLVTHLVLQGSMDAILANIACGKGSIIDLILGKGARREKFDQSDWGREYIDPSFMSSDTCPF